MNKHIYRITPCQSNIAYPDVNYLERICDRQKPGKGCGDENFTIKELNELGEEFSLGLKEVVCKSILTSKYPSIWKTGKVIAVCKKGATKERENYRPISLISIPSKIYETIISETLDKHITNFNLSTENQWGFKKRLNTESTLLYLTETWKRYMEEGKVIGVMLIDFQKAFNTVDHTILGYKLKAMGITGDLLALLKDYLSNRSQYVNVEGKHSNVTLIEIGVPQGSLLGPRRFAIYVNDFPFCTKIGEIHLYADDTTAFVVCNTIDETVLALNILANEIADWCDENCLTIHTGKREAIIITDKCFIGPLNQIKIKGHGIQVVKESKTLGVFIDQKLSWKKQVTTVRKSFNTKIKLL